MRLLPTARLASCSPISMQAFTKAALRAEFGVPLVPLRKFKTDLFHFENCLYLIVVDYYSGFPVIHKLQRMTYKHVISYMKDIFSEYEWTDTLMSDNGSCYKCAQATYCRDGCAPHNKLIPLTPIECTGRKIYTACKKLVGKSQGIG